MPRNGRPARPRRPPAWGSNPPVAGSLLGALHWAPSSTGPPQALSAADHLPYRSASPLRSGIPRGERNGAYQTERYTATSTGSNRDTDIVAGFSPPPRAWPPRPRAPAAPSP